MEVTLVSQQRGESDAKQLRSGYGTCVECGYHLGCRKRFGGVHLFHAECPICILTLEIETPETVLERLLQKYQQVSLEVKDTSKGIQLLQREVKRLMEKEEGTTAVNTDFLLLLNGAVFPEIQQRLDEHEVTPSSMMEQLRSIREQIVGLCNPGAETQTEVVAVAIHDMTKQFRELLVSVDNNHSNSNGSSNGSTTNSTDVAQKEQEIQALSSVYPTIVSSVKRFPKHLRDIKLVLTSLEQQRRLLQEPNKIDVNDESVDKEDVATNDDKENGTSNGKENSKGNITENINVSISANVKGNGNENGIINGKKFNETTENSASSLGQSLADLNTSFDSTDSTSSVVDTIRELGETSSPARASALCDKLCEIATSDQEAKKSLVAEQGISTVIGAMWQHDHPGLYMNGCKVLRHMAYGSLENPAHIVKHGVIDLVLHIVRQHSTRVSVLEECLELLRWLAFKNPGIASRMGESGVMRAVLSSLQLHPSHAPLQLSGLMVLMVLAEQNEPNKELIREAGGVDQTLACVRDHPTHTKIQFYGFCALAGLMSGSNGAKDRMRDGGGVDLALTALQTHPTEARIQHMGLVVLRELTKGNPESKTEIDERGGVELILKALRLFPSTVVVQQAGCGAIQEVSLDNANNQDYIRECGGIAVVLESMRLHANRAEVQSAACGAMNNLMDRNAANQTEIFSAGGIPLVLNALRQHPTSAAVQVAGSWTILGLAFGSDNSKNAIRDGGGIELLLNGLKQHLPQANLQEAGCWALGRLADGNAENQSAVGSCGGIESILQSMRQHPQIEKVQKNGCWALDRLVSNDHEDNAKRFQDAQGSEVVILAIQTHGVNLNWRSSLRQLLKKQ